MKCLINLLAPTGRKSLLRNGLPRGTASAVRPASCKPAMNRPLILPHVAAAQKAFAADPKYKKYTQQVERCLNSFDNVHEWADCIAFLKQLLKVRAPSHTARNRALLTACFAADIPILHAVQGDSTQVGCREAPFAVFESCPADRCAPTGSGCLFAYPRCSGGTSYPRRHALQLIVYILVRRPQTRPCIVVFRTVPVL